MLKLREERSDSENTLSCYKGCNLIRILPWTCKHSFRSPGFSKAPLKVVGNESVLAKPLRMETQSDLRISPPGGLCSNPLIPLLVHMCNIISCSSKTKPDSLCEIVTNMSGAVGRLTSFTQRSSTFSTSSFSEIPS